MSDYKADYERSVLNGDRLFDEVERLRAALAEAERPHGERALVAQIKCLQVANANNLARAERAEAALAEAREVIEGIIKRWDDNEDRSGNERYGEMALYEDMEPEMEKARAFINRLLP